jgi:hypothetical protein
VKLLIERTYNVSTTCGRIWLQSIKRCNRGRPIQLLLGVTELSIAYPITDFFEATIILLVKSSLQHKKQLNEQLQTIANPKLELQTHHKSQAFQ